MHPCILIYVVTVILVSSVRGYSSGAGDSACTNGLVPGHNASPSPQSTDSPYKVMISDNKYKPGETIKGKFNQLIIVCCF